jgi:hypothetical protein
MPQAGSMPFSPRSRLGIGKLRRFSDTKMRFVDMSGVAFYPLMKAPFRFLGPRRPSLAVDPVLQVLGTRSRLIFET